MAKVHGVTSETRVTTEAAHQVAELMAGLGTASRVLILGRLREGACSVTELCASVQIPQPAVSQQLRVLRNLELVVGSRVGRQTIYALHDDHVGVLLDEARRHIDHLHDHAANAPRLSTTQATPGAP